MKTNLFCLLLALGGLSAGAAPLDDAEFRRLHSLIQPAAGEQDWEQIPWMASLWEARERAAAEGRPILLWEMDGHPLGCV